MKTHTQKLLQSTKTVITLFVLFPYHIMFDVHRVKTSNFKIIVPFEKFKRKRHSFLEHHVYDSSILIRHLTSSFKIDTIKIMCYTYLYKISDSHLEVGITGILII